MSIKNNTASLQSLLEAINALPNAGSVEPTSQNKTVNIDVTVTKGNTVCYLNANKEKCSITGTAVKGSIFNIDAYCGVIYTEYNVDSTSSRIYGMTGNYICSSDMPQYDNHFVMFLDDGGTASTIKQISDIT